jgi:hypothetical protein
MRLTLAFVAVMGASLLGLHYYNTNAGKPPAERIAFVPYLKGLVGLQEPPPPPDAAARAVAWLKSWTSPGTAAAPADADAIAAALAKGQTGEAAAMAEAEFARVSAVLAAAEAEAEAAEKAERDERKRRKKGEITLGSGSCGDRAGGGKFCAVGD